MEFFFSIDVNFLETLSWYRDVLVLWVSIEYTKTKQTKILAFALDRSNFALTGPLLRDRTGRATFRPSLQPFGKLVSGSWCHSFRIYGQIFSCFQVIWAQQLEGPRVCSATIFLSESCKLNRLRCWMRWPLSPVVSLLKLRQEHFCLLCKLTWMAYLCERRIPQSSVHS